MAILEVSCMAHAWAGRAAIPRYGGRYGVLAGDIFAAYLWGQMPADVLTRIIWAVQEHSTHRKIVAFMKERLEKKASEVKRILTTLEVRDTCAAAVEDFRMPAPGPAGAGDRALVRPYYSGDLQQIISGIHSIGLRNASYALGGVHIVEGSYNIKDAYDFDNDRSMFPYYDSYRKKLTALYIEDRDATINLYSRCVTTYEQDMLLAPSDGASHPINGPISRPLLFTAFMYALEKGGLTKSLYWSADIPFEIDFSTDSVRLGQAGQPIQDASQGSARLVGARLPDLPGAPRRMKFRTFLPPKTRTEPVSETYVVKKGDNLTLIAKRLYGDAGQWKLIYDANRKVIGANPNFILPGQVFSIPR